MICPDVRTWKETYHDHCGTSLDIVGSSTKGLTASSCGITLEAGRILLEGLATCTITWSVWVNCQLSVICPAVEAREFRRDIPPMADPAPPASPVAPMIAAWPATRLLEARRAKETVAILENILNRSKMWIK
jgi:hypothetical protein